MKTLGAIAVSSIKFGPGPPWIWIFVMVEAAAGPVPGSAPSIRTFPPDAALMTIGSSNVLDTVNTPPATDDVSVRTVRFSSTSRFGANRDPVLRRAPREHCVSE